MRWTWPWPSRRHGHGVGPRAMRSDRGVGCYFWSYFGAKLFSAFCLFRASKNRPVFATADVADSMRSCGLVVSAALLIVGACNSSVSFNIRSA